MDKTVFQFNLLIIQPLCKQKSKIINHFDRNLSKCMTF